MTDSDIPDVEDTDLTREEMEEVAGEYGIDPDELDDQQLLERLGVALGHIGEAEVEDRDAGGDGDEDQPSGAGLRAKVAASLEGAADRLRPADAEPPDAGTDDEGEAGTSQDAEAEEKDEADEGDSEQARPGESIEGRTRNEIRDELRELGQPVTGTKAELQERLDEARRDQDDEKDEADEGDEKDEGDEGDSEQARPGEPIEGRTRDEIRDELRELGLPVTGTKDELRERLDEARAEQANEDGEAGGDAGSGDEDADDEEDDDDRLRDRAADGLKTAAHWLQESGRDGGGISVPSRLKLAGKAVKRRIPFVGR